MDDMNVAIPYSVIAEEFLCPICFSDMTVGSLAMPRVDNPAIEKCTPISTLVRF